VIFLAVKDRKGIGIYLAVIAFIFIALIFWLTSTAVEQVKYSKIIELFNTNAVTEFELNLGSGKLQITADKDKVADEFFEKKYATQSKEDPTKAIIKYTVPNVSLFVDEISETVRLNNLQKPDNQIVYNYTPAEKSIWTYIISYLPVLLLIGMMVFLWFSMMRQSGGGVGGAMNFSKAKIKQHSDEQRKTTFADVAGADEEKEELKEIVEFLKNPKKFNELGARIPKGVLLVGPPGTGKTLLARAVAGEAGAPFFSISGSDFVEMFVGVGASRVRDLFDQAKKESPSIIFIDEIDAVGRHRGAGLGGGHDEREQTLNQLLVEMDGFGANQGVIVMAATNRRDILDPALLRPGRFDRQIVVGYPDVKGREEILKVHARNKPLGPDVDLSVIAKTTSGFTGADLENLLNEAALLAARDDLKAITMPNVEEATIKIIAGPEKKSHVVMERDKKITAYHEVGHAICTYFSPTQDPVHQISIIPRGMAAGYTMSLPVQEKGHMTKTDMKENVVTLLGGRVAEKLVFDEITTGASNDIERATSIARNMVMKFGFSDKLGPICYGSEQGEVFLGRDFNQSRNYSEEIASVIDKEIHDIVDTAYNRAKEILSDNMPKLHEIAKILFEREKLDGEEFKALMEGTFENSTEQNEPNE
jgi:cell division protease FtsH